MIWKQLETLALSQAIPNMSDETIDLPARLVEMAASLDTSTFLKLDRMFHLASYHDAGMRTAKRDLRRERPALQPADILEQMLSALMTAGPSS